MLEEWTHEGEEREKYGNTENLKGCKHIYIYIYIYIKLIRQYTHSNQFTDVGMLQCFNDQGGSAGLWKG